MLWNSLGGLFTGLKSSNSICTKLFHQPVLGWSVSWLWVTALSTSLRLMSEFLLGLSAWIAAICESICHTFMLFRLSQTYNYYYFDCYLSFHIYSVPMLWNSFGKFQFPTSNCSKCSSVTWVIFHHRQSASGCEHNRGSPGFARLRGRDSKGELDGRGIWFGVDERTLRPDGGGVDDSVAISHAVCIQLTIREARDGRSNSEPPGYAPWGTLPVASNCVRRYFLNPTKSTDFLIPLYHFEIHRNSPITMAYQPTWWWVSLAGVS